MIALPIKINSPKVENPFLPTVKDKIHNDKIASAQGSSGS